MKSRVLKLLLVFCVAVFGIAIKTYVDILPCGDLIEATAHVSMVQIVDRNQAPLSVSYQNQWNTYDAVALNQIPVVLRNAFVLSEDQYFFEHKGIDWNARIMAAWQAVRFQKVYRGASTISEQVVRMLHPRPRTLWSKWLETFEVGQLEKKYTKAQILQFYLNQIPYASNRRGILQAARFYFNRDLSTLTAKEMLALVVLARAPSRYDLYKDKSSVEGSIQRLAHRMCQQKLLEATTCDGLSGEELQLSPPVDPVNASHFIRFVRENQLGSHDKIIHTTLDANLQKSVQSIIDQRLKSLKVKGVHNAGALVVDHQTGEILCWVVAGANQNESAPLVPGNQIDAVTSKRQPASTLKPFLYALALDMGWTAATKIKDTPLADVIGEGYHRFQNYSRSFHGDISLRKALGNSLNIPALRTIKFTGTSAFYDKMHALGLSSLTNEKEYYDEGLALGNGEITLLELVRAYVTLANKGRFKDFRYVYTADERAKEREVFSSEAASIIGNILSDPKARQMEFGAASVLNLPVQTAVKTGTSNDYHDAWAVGYNYRYAVGIWMGNLDRTRTDGVTGGTGPALAMRSIFAELTRNEETRPLYLSPTLVKREVCADENVQPCVTYAEYFMQDTLFEPKALKESSVVPQIAVPVQGMQVAIDPRVNRKDQKLAMQISNLPANAVAEWRMDGRVLASAGHSQLLWPLEEGKHRLEVSILQNNLKTTLNGVEFSVK